MPASEADVATPADRRYLQQLCKHWSHKFPVEFTADAGRIPFAADRTCDLTATAEKLTMRISAADEATLERMQGVVVEHLRRFAFRENLDEVRWTRLEEEAGEAARGGSA